MSFTTLETVKKHLVENRVAISQIESEPMKLLAGTPASVKYPPISLGTEKVKAREQTKPDYQIVSFAGGNQVVLNKPELVIDSIVVASDSSLGLVYRENLDYTVDYDNGILTRISSGNIPASGAVSVWFVPYRIYARGIDYSVNYATGKITLLVSGDIESSQMVYVDYISEYAAVDDEIIKNAIVEANEQVISYIDNQYVISSDRSLVVAETYLAVSIICRIKVLWANSSGAKSSTGASWSVLSEQYKRDGYLLLEKFTGSTGGLHAPHKA